MIKILATLFLVAFFQMGATAQTLHSVVGFFDNDELDDTLSYRYQDDSITGPCYHITIVRGCGEVQEFKLGVDFESMEIGYWRKGWICCYQLKGGSSGFELFTDFRFEPRYDDWLFVKESLKYPGEKPAVKHAEIPWGLSGREYPKPVRKQKPKAR